MPASAEEIDYGKLCSVLCFLHPSVCSDSTAASGHSPLHFSVPIASHGSTRTPVCQGHLGNSEAPAHRVTMGEHWTIAGVFRCTEVLCFGLVSASVMLG